MDILILLHLTSLSFWLGVVSVEFIFERACIEKSAVVRLHKLTDRYVELPIITVVFLTGLLLWKRVDWSLNYLPKVLVGSGAVFSNVICYYFVEKRTSQKESYKRYSRFLYKLTLLGVVCFIIAFILGGNHAGWW